MNNHALKPSELKLLLRCNGIQNYKWKSFLSGGSSPRILLENTINSQLVIGKIVTLPTDEPIVWSGLKHQNLNPLLDILYTENNRVKILISPAVGRCIGSVVQDNSFVQHPMCFQRKKSYARNVLSGVSYMHQNNVCLLNLNDANVQIDAFMDRAVICDFSNVAIAKKIRMRSLPPDVAVSYKPPEVENAQKDEILNTAPIDVWCCGLLFLQIFTQYILPWCGDLKNSLEYLDTEILSKANVGASLGRLDAIELKRFLKNLLSEDPNLRISASEAFELDFLQPVYDRLDDRARRFWKAGAINQYSLDGSPLRNSETSSFYSEIDFSLASEYDVPGPSFQHQSDLTRLSNLTRTKSEPANAKISEEPPFPHCDVITMRASLPSLPCRENSDSVLLTTNLRKMESTVELQIIRSHESDVGSALRDHSRRDVRHQDVDNAIRNGFDGKSAKVSPYDVFLTEWEPDFFSAEDWDPEEEAELKSSDQILRSSFAEETGAVPKKHLNVGISPTECGLGTKKQRGTANPRESYYGTDMEGRYYSEDQRQINCPTSRGSAEDRISTCSFDIPLDPSKTTSLRSSDFAPRQKWADYILHKVLNSSTEMYVSCSPSEDRDDDLYSGEDNIPLPLETVEDAHSPAKSIESEWVVPSEKELNNGGDKSPPIRKKWYYRLLCSSCKNKRK